MASVPYEMRIGLYGIKVFVIETPALPDIVLDVPPVLARDHYVSVLGDGGARGFLSLRIRDQGDRCNRGMGRVYRRIVNIG